MAIEETEVAVVANLRPAWTFWRDDKTIINQMEVPLGILLKLALAPNDCLDWLGVVERWKSYLAQTILTLFTA